MYRINVYACFQIYKPGDFGSQLHQPEEPGHQGGEEDFEGAGILCSCPTSSQGMLYQYYGYLWCNLGRKVVKTALR